MSIYAAEFMRQINPYRDGEARVRRKGKYRLINFVRPNIWPFGYTIEQSFGVYRWMVETADNYPDARRCGRNALEPVLSCVSRLPSDVAPITSLRGLEERFRWAMFAVYGLMGTLERWRAEYGIRVEGVHWIRFPHYEPFNGPSSERDFGEMLTAMFTDRQRLTVQLNECHDGARENYGVHLHLGKSFTNCEGKFFYSGWRFDLSYGYKGSVWEHTLAREEQGEPFWDVAQRAYDALRKLEA